MQNHGELFRNYVNSRNLNKSSIARSLGVSSQNLYQLFGSKNFKQETIRNIEKALNVTWQEIENAEIDPTAKKNPHQSDADYQTKYVALLEKRVRELEVQQAQIQELSNRLDELRRSIVAVGASQKGYQDYWAEHYPPKGVSSDQMKLGVRKKAAEVLAEFLQTGIQI